MRRILILLLLSFLSAFCLGQNKADKTYRFEEHCIHSGYHENAYNENTNLVFKKVIDVPKALWLRVIFNDYYLGKNSYITITSVKDNSMQIHRTESLKNWRNKSAAFNGGKLEIKLFNAADDIGVFFSIDTLIAGQIPKETSASKSLCGSDNRVSSYDGRVGRLARGYPAGYGTVWLAANGAILTASHVLDEDRNGLMDLDAGDFIEFDVKGSNANGAINFADANDQYPIDLASIVISGDYNTGGDWAIFKCLPNANTGLLPHEAQNAFFRVTNEVPGYGEIFSITGYGFDDSPPGSGPTLHSRYLNYKSGTQQTSSGSYKGETTNGAYVYHSYEIDTDNANSGSPIINKPYDDYVIGVHTKGGCHLSDKANYGTSFNNYTFSDAMQNFLGANVTYVDSYYDGTYKVGTLFEPYVSIQNGVDNAVSGSKLYLIAGTYTNNAGLSINKQITILPPACGSIKINP